jgi:sodium-dependent dicarboxylate transporter 2/3/5
MHTLNLWESGRKEVAAIAEKAWYQRAGLWAGPILSGIILLSPAPDGLSTAGWRTAAAGILMAVWWATEALPVAVTALLPIALFPLMQISDVKAATAPYANSTIYLFLGGFLVALAVQRCGLHKRIALTVIVLFGGSGASMIGGFMVAGEHVGDQHVHNHDAPADRGLGSGSGRPDPGRQR